MMKFTATLLLCLVSAAWAGAFRRSTILDEENNAIFYAKRAAELDSEGTLLVISFFAKLLSLVKLKVTASHKVLSAFLSLLQDYC